VHDGEAVAAQPLEFVAMVFGAETILFWPLLDTQKMRRETAVYLPEPQLVSPISSDDGPVVVETTQTVTREHQRAVLEAMIQLRLSRLRTGATD
jgi:hypothetical protein